MSRKRKKGEAERSQRTLSLAAGAPIYAAVWVAALIFTQALRAAASNLFFTFIILLPLSSLIYLFIARGALKVTMSGEGGKTEKLAPYEYEFRMINESWLAFPFTRVMLCLPQANSVRVSEREVIISLAPGESYTVKNSVRFRFRGRYEIGVRCFYVYDLFRILRMCIDIDRYETVEVMPRRLWIDDDPGRAASDSAKQTVKLPNSYDKLEVSDIREYRLGDTLKSIHWNLSSKGEELVVRDYNTGTTSMTNIFCDMGAHFPDEEPREEGTADTDAGEDNGQGKSRKSKKANKAQKTAQKAKKTTKQTRAAAKEGSDIPLPAPLRLARPEYYEDMNEYCADGAVELTIAAVLRELRAGNAVRLLWFDERAVLGAFAYELTSEADLALIFEFFATAPIIRGSARRQVTELSAMLRDGGEARNIYVIPAIDDSSLAAFCGAHSTDGAVSVEVMLYDPVERFADADEHHAYIENCRAQLGEGGRRLVTHNTDTSHAAYDARGREAGERHAE